MTTTLRICTLNVHGWRDEAGNGRVDEVIALLRGWACDVVMLNEVPDDDERGELAHVARALSMHRAYAPAQYAGNALLSRAPMHDVAKLALTTRAETRSAVIADVTLSAGDTVCVACTHLEQRREAVRVEQMATLQSALRSRERVILGGDLNALTLGDYAVPRLAAIKAHREASGWEAPVDTLTSRMSASGWVDAAQRSGALGRTCWAGTRIDYVWLDRLLAARVRHVDAFVADVDVSDHRPLVVTLHL